MLELWLKLKILFDYIIPFILFGLFLLFCFIYIIYIYIKSIKWNKKIKLLQKEKYERYLIRVASVGNGAWYGWKNKEYNHRISEDELDKINYSSLKGKINYVKQNH